MAEKKVAKDKKTIKKEKPAKDEIRTVPEYKIKLVETLANKIRKSKTVLIASTKGLPSSQFHEIKKKMRGTAEISVAKKNLVLKAIAKVEKGALQNLKEQIGADIALFFSDMDAFELSGLLSESKSPAKAKSGDISPEDIIVEAGPTELVPGPAISELSAVGLKVIVEKGKLAIKDSATIVKAGQVIKENVASVMAKLNISPMNVGFEPLAAYDAVSDKVYVGIKVDKKGTLESLHDSIKRGLGFAINVKYPTAETVKFYIYKAANEEKALSAIAQKAETGAAKPAEEPKVEEKKEEVKVEEKKEESVNDTSTKEGK